MQELRKMRLKMHVVIEKWEWGFRKDVEADEELKAFFKEYEPYFPIKPRDAFFSWRTNAIAPHRQEADIRYVDFTSLYPWVCKYGLFPLGHPSVFYKDDIPDRVQGLLKCKVLPPSRLYHPLLPHQNQRQVDVCAVPHLQGDCSHKDEERALTGMWVLLEIDKVLALGYRMVTKYAAWHFKETMQYKDGVGGLWAEYIDLLLKLKQEASGYPSWCTTEKLKKRYMADYQCHEGMHQSPTRIVKNDGLRSLCKIMLNFHWGEFGQNPDKSKVTYVSYPAEYIEMMITDDTIEVTEPHVCQQGACCHQVACQGGISRFPSHYERRLTAYTTAQARLKLYTLLERLQERVLYFDTTV